MPAEIIVVDNGSTDGALQFLEQFPDIDVIHLAPDNFGYARAFNLGMRHARASSPFLVRLSGDAVPACADWLANLLASFADDPGVAAVFSRQISPRGLNNPMERLTNALYYPPGRPRRRFPHPVNVLGGNLALRRPLWEAHPFDESIPQAEDFAWVQHWTRRGFHVVYTPDSPILHGHDEPLGKALRRSLTQTALKMLLRRRI